MSGSAQCPFCVSQVSVLWLVTVWQRWDCVLFPLSAAPRAALLLTTASPSACEPKPSSSLAGNRSHSHCHPLVTQRPRSASVPQPPSCPRASARAVPCCLPPLPCLARALGGALLECHHLQAACLGHSTPGTALLVGLGSLAHAFCALPVLFVIKPLACVCSPTRQTTGGRGGVCGECSCVPSARPGSFTPICRHLFIP